MITIQDLRTWNTPLSESPIKVQTFFRSLKKKFRVSSITGNFWSREEPLVDSAIVRYTGLNLFHFDPADSKLEPLAGYLYDTDWCYLLVAHGACYKIDVDFVKEEINNVSVTMMLATDKTFSRCGRARYITLDELFEPKERSCKQLDKLFESFHEEAIDVSGKNRLVCLKKPAKYRLRACYTDGGVLKIAYGAEPTKDPDFWGVIYRLGDSYYALKHKTLEFYEVSEDFKIGRATSFTFKYWVEKFPEPIKAVFKC